MRKACQYDFPCEGTCDFCYDPCRCNASLDAAWAEAEAALPEGWTINTLSCGTRSTMLVGSFVSFAQAGDWTPRPWGEHHPTVEVHVDGPDRTPAGALRALAAKLREVKS